MSFLIQCDFCGIQGEPQGDQYCSPNQWREIRIHEGHTLRQDYAIHACPDCAKKLWPNTKVATVTELVDCLMLLTKLKGTTEDEYQKGPVTEISNGTYSHIQGVIAKNGKKAKAL